MKQGKFGKLSKRVIAVSMSAIVLASCVGIAASAADTRYSFDTDYHGSGPVWWLDSNKKDYRNVTVSCSQSGAKSTMQLWKNWILGDVRYERDQTFTVGTNRRAWWFGDTSNTAQYHITARVYNNNNATVAFTGYLNTFK